MNGHMDRESMIPIADHTKTNFASLIRLTQVTTKATSTINFVFNCLKTYATNTNSFSYCSTSLKN